MGLKWGQPLFQPESGTRPFDGCPESSLLNHPSESSLNHPRDVYQAIEDPNRDIRHFRRNLELAASVWSSQSNLTIILTSSDRRHWILTRDCKLKRISDFKYLIAAIFISPVVGTFVGLSVADIGLLFLMDFNSWVHNLPQLIVSNAGMTVIGIVFSLPVVLLYGVPVFFFLRWLRLQTFWMFGLFGILPTTISTLFSWFNQDAALLDYAYVYSRGALTGLSVACFFWFIAVYFPARMNKRREANRHSSQIG